MAITIQGNQLNLYVANTESGTKQRIAHAQTVALDFSNALIDVTTKDSNSWMEHLSGRRSFTVSADGLIDDYATTSTTRQTNIVMGGFAIAGTVLFFDFGVGNARWQGSFFIDSFNQTGGSDAEPTYSISGTGTGALTYDADITQ